MQVMPALLVQVSSWTSLGLPAGACIRLPVYCMMQYHHDVTPPCATTGGLLSHMRDILRHNGGALSRNQQPEQGNGMTETAGNCRSFHTAGSSSSSSKAGAGQGRAYDVGVLVGCCLHTGYAWQGLWLSQPQLGVVLHLRAQGVGG